MIKFSHDLKPLFSNHSSEFSKGLLSECSRLNEMNSKSALVMQKHVIVSARGKMFAVIRLPVAFSTSNFTGMINYSLGSRKETSALFVSLERNKLFLFKITLHKELYFEG